MIGTSWLLLGVDSPFVALIGLVCCSGVFDPEALSLDLSKKIIEHPVVERRPDDVVRAIAPYRS